MNLNLFHVPFSANLQPWLDLLTISSSFKNWTPFVFQVCASTTLDSFFTCLALNGHGAYFIIQTLPCHVLLCQHLRSSLSIHIQHITYKYLEWYNIFKMSLTCNNTTIQGHKTQCKSHKLYWKKSLHQTKKTYNNKTCVF